MSKKKRRLEIDLQNAVERKPPRTRIGKFVRQLELAEKDPEVQAAEKEGFKNGMRAFRHRLELNGVLRPPDPPELEDEGDHIEQEEKTEAELEAERLAERERALKRRDEEIERSRARRRERLESPVVNFEKKALIRRRRIAESRVRRARRLQDEQFWGRVMSFGVVVLYLLARLFLKG